jgi:hypothetical protein
MEPAVTRDMANKTAIPELETPQKRRPEIKPEMKRPQRREPEIPHVPDGDEHVVDKDDQADSGPDKGNPITQESKRPLTPADGHIGAREDQMSDTQAPAGDEFEDEPKQG